MAKPLPKEDFRSMRIVLEPHDFAWGSENPERPPKDLILKETWKEIVSLPDDVAIRTSNNYGQILKELSEFQYQLLDVLSAVREIAKKAGADVNKSPICHVVFFAYEDLQASIYNALTGYYRIAFSALRNVLENFTVGLHLELLADSAQFEIWFKGNHSSRDFLFGWGADNLPQHKSVSDLEEQLTKSAGDNFFRQRSPVDPGGFVRRLFGQFSKYVHGKPGCSHGDIWGSNGPVFVPDSLIDWAINFVQVYSFCLIACRLAYPSLNKLGARETLEGLFIQATQRLTVENDGKKLYESLPGGFW